MTVWTLIRVPSAESDIAKAAGAEWSRLDRSWMCNATQSSRSELGWRQAKQ